MKLLAGTSGWSYQQWKQDFYPTSCTADWLEYYAGRLVTVEVNNSFYKIPAQAMIEKWVRVVPDGFKYAVKAWQGITRVKRLQNCDDEVKLFFTMLQFFRGTLGPVLFQLPPSLQYDLELLKNFLAKLPGGVRYAFEFRHISWFCEETYELLRANNTALVLTHVKKWTVPMLKTADFVYIRLHGAEALYKGKYDDEFLLRLYEWTKKAGAEESFVYFNNTMNGIDAVSNAMRLNEIFMAAAGEPNG